MKFELVEAYPIGLLKKEIMKKDGWSLHLYFPDLEMDLRGIRAYKMPQGHWLILMPYRRAWDFEEEKYVEFPLISFLDTEKTKNLKNEISKACEDYIPKKLKEKWEKLEEKLKIFAK